MAFELQPTLMGELLHLRPLRVQDFDALYAVASDPLLWEQHPNSDRYKREVFQAFFQDALASRGALITLDAKYGKVIGSSRFYGYDPQNSEIEIGWTFLARSHWGGRFNREMKRLMLQHAFRFVLAIARWPMRISVCAEPGRSMTTTRRDAGGGSIGVTAGMFLRGQPPNARSAAANASSIASPPPRSRKEA